MSARRRQLSSAAALLFADRGYHNVGMDDIAAAVGLTGPALYRHFRGKHDILIQILVEQLEAVDEVALSAIAESDDSKVRRERFISELAELLIRRDELILWKREHRQLAGAAQELLRSKTTLVVQHAIQALGAGRDGVVSADDELRAWTVLVICYSIHGVHQRVNAVELQRLLHGMADKVLTCPLSIAIAPASVRAPSPIRKPAGRRERILDAAVDLFSAKGYHEVGTDEIAAASGIAVATLYQYFASKADLLEAIFVRGAVGFQFVTRQRLATAANAREALHAVATTLIEHVLGPHRPLLSVRAADLIYLNPEAQSSLMISEDEYIQEWVVSILEIRPELSAQVAHVLARTSIDMVDDLALNSRISARPTVQSDLLQLVNAVLATS